MSTAKVIRSGCRALKDGQSMYKNHSLSTTVALSTMAPAKSQPWRDVWPPKAENYSEAELKSMPWLNWKPDPAKPDERPWRQWMAESSTAVVKRGSW